MGGRTRLFAAIFGAAGIFTIIGAALSAPLYVLPDYGFSGALQESVSLFLFCVALIVMFGIPLHAWLQNKRDFAAKSYIFCGGTVGAVCGLLIVIVAAPILAPGLGSAAAPLFLLMPVICIFGGVVLAFLFWLIRRPDRDAPTQNTETADHAA